MNNNGKCYFVSDLEDAPLEYLEKIMSLIDKFKTDNISKKKNKKLFNDEYFSELKDDQIRIIL